MCRPRCVVRRCLGCCALAWRGGRAQTQGGVDGFRAGRPCASATRAAANKAGSSCSSAASSSRSDLLSTIALLLAQAATAAPADDVDFVNDSPAPATFLYYRVQLIAIEPSKFNRLYSEILAELCPSGAEPFMTDKKYKEDVFGNYNDIIYFYYCCRCNFNY